LSKRFNGLRALMPIQSIKRLGLDTIETPNRQLARKLRAHKTPNAKRQGKFSKSSWRRSRRAKTARARTCVLETAEGRMKRLKEDSQDIPGRSVRHPIRVSELGTAENNACVSQTALRASYPECSLCSLSFAVFAAVLCLLPCCRRVFVVLAATKQ